MESLIIFLAQNPLIELGVITLVLVITWRMLKVFKQPILIWYIVAGLLLWPQLFDVITHYEKIQLYAYFGVSLLLFMVGLWLNPSIVKEVWKVASIAWIGQVLFTFCIGFAIALLIWFDLTTAWFIAVALTFSSTIVIVKLVSDRGDSWTTYGKIALWILIVQDIIAMLILLVISASTIDSGWVSNIAFVWTIVAKVIWLLWFAWIASKRILPKIMQSLSDEKELLLLFVITWAILFWWLWYYAWFSMEIWALLAWVTLASSRYRFHIFSELRPFRDFFLALFFVYLWWQIVFDNLWSMIVPIILFSWFVLIGNPTIIITLMIKLWYGRKDSFMTWLTVAQISEFSFIIIWLALTAWTLDDPNILSLVTIIGLVTMTGSSYLFANADRIFAVVSPYIAFLEKKKTTCDDLTAALSQTTNSYRMIIVWYWRLWKYIASKLKLHQIPFCIIDHEPSKVEAAEKAWYTVVYGDVSDNDLLWQLIWADTEIIYSTINDHDTAIHVLHISKIANENTKVISLASYIDEAEHLYNQWSDYVVFPHMSGAHESRDILEKHVWNPEEFLLSKIRNREALMTHKNHIQE